MIDPKELIKVGEASTMIGVSMPSINYYILRGYLKKVEISGRIFLVRKNVEKLAEIKRKERELEEQMRQLQEENKSNFTNLGEQ